MEREIESKTFILANYRNKEEINQDIERYIKQCKMKYKDIMITEEFGIGETIIVKIIKIDEKINSKVSEIRENARKKSERTTKEIIEENNRNYEKALKERPKGGLIRERER